MVSVSSHFSDGQRMTLEHDVLVTYIMFRGHMKNNSLTWSCCCSHIYCIKTFAFDFIKCLCSKTSKDNLLYHRFCFQSFEHKSGCPSGKAYDWPRCALCIGICDWLKPVKASQKRGVRVKTPERTKTCQSPTAYAPGQARERILSSVYSSVEEEEDALTYPRSVFIST